MVRSGSACRSINSCSILSRPPNLYNIPIQDLQRQYKNLLDRYNHVVGRSQQQAGRGTDSTGSTSGASFGERENEIE